MSDFEEQQIQFNLIEWLRLQYQELLYTISPGGLLTNARVGGKANKLGYQKGVPDLMIFQPKGKYHGLFVELKREKGGVVSEHQEEFLRRANELGYYAVVCCGFEEAKKVIDDYFSLQKM